MRSLTIRIPKKLRQELEKLSRDRRQSVSDLVRESLRRYAAVGRFRAIRKKTMPLAEAEGFLTDEDVFKAVS
jgi:Arc/MetJ-type ribon-helix-helix transcriptional regulator